MPFCGPLNRKSKDICEKAVVAHVDIDPAEIGKVVKTQIPIVGDAKRALEILLEADGVKTRHDDWTESVLANKAKAPLAMISMKRLSNHSMLLQQLVR